MGAGSHAGRARQGQGHRPASAATLGLKYPNRAQPHPLIILGITKKMFGTEENFTVILLRSAKHVILG